jgi:hypothetical protein
MSSREENGWLEKLTPLLRELKEEGVLDPHWRKDSEDPETPRGVLRFYIWGREEKCFFLHMNLPTRYTRAGMKQDDWKEYSCLNRPGEVFTWKLVSIYNFVFCEETGQRSWRGLFQDEELAPDMCYDLHLVRDKDMASYSLEAAHREFFDLRGEI